MAGISEKSSLGSTPWLYIFIASVTASTLPVRSPLPNKMCIRDRGSALDILVGYKVLQHNGDMLFIKHAVNSGAFKLLEVQRGGDVVAQPNVQLCVDEVACLDLRQSGVCGKDHAVGP